MRKILVWRTEHPAWTRVDAQWWDDAGTGRVENITTEAAHALLDSLFAGESTRPEAMRVHLRLKKKAVPQR